MGSVGCKIASIIRGESDIYISMSLPEGSSPKDWDFAAPEAILKAEGGAITTIDNQNLLYNGENYEQRGIIIASNNKDIHGENSHNQRTISAFLRNIPNFLDYRFEFKEIDEKSGEIIYEKSVEIFNIVLEIQNTGLNRSLIKSLSEKLHEFESLCDFSSETRTSIQSFKEALEDYNKTGIFPLETGSFATWFGRGQQYLSFIRKSKFTDGL